MPLTERQIALFDHYTKIGFRLKSSWNDKNIQDIYENLTKIFSLYTEETNPVNEILKDLEAGFEVINASEKRKTKDAISLEEITSAKEFLNTMILKIKDKPKGEALSILEKEYFIDPMFVDLEMDVKNIRLIFTKALNEPLDKKENPFKAFEALKECENKIFESRLLLKKVENWVEKTKLVLPEAVSSIPTKIGEFSKKLESIEMDIGEFRLLSFSSGLEEDQKNILKDIVNSLKDFNSIIFEINRKTIENSIQTNELDAEMKDATEKIKTLSDWLEPIKNFLESETLKSEASETIEELKEKNHVLRDGVLKLEKEINKENKLKINLENEKNNIDKRMKTIEELKKDYREKSGMLILEREAYQERERIFNQKVGSLNESLERKRDEKQGIGDSIKELKGLYEKCSNIKGFEAEEFVKEKSLIDLSTKFLDGFDNEINALRISVLEKKNFTEVPEIVEKIKNEGEPEGFQKKDDSTDSTKVVKMAGKRDLSYKDLTVLDFQTLENSIKNDTVEALGIIVTRIFSNQSPPDLVDLLNQIRKLIYQDANEKKISPDPEILVNKIIFIEGIFRIYGEKKDLIGLKKWKAFYNFDFKTLETQLLEVKNGLEKIELNSFMDEEETAQVLKTESNIAKEMLEKVLELKSFDESPESNTDNILELLGVSIKEIEGTSDQIRKESEINNEEKENLKKSKEVLSEYFNALKEKYIEVDEKRKKLYIDYNKKEVENKEEILGLLKKKEEWEEREINLGNQLKEEKEKNKEELNKQSSRSIKYKNDEEEIFMNKQILGDLTKEFSKANLDLKEEGKFLLESIDSRKIIGSVISDLKVAINEAINKLERYEPPEIDLEPPEGDLSEEITIQDELELDSILSNFSEMETKKSLEELNELDKEIKNILEKDWPSSQSVYAEMFPGELNTGLNPKPIEYIKNKDDLIEYYNERLEAQKNKITDAPKISTIFLKFLNEIPEKDSEQSLTSCSKKGNEILINLETDESSKNIFVNSINEALKKNFTTLKEIKAMFNNETEKQKKLLETAEQLVSDLAGVMARIENSSDEKELCNEIEHKVNHELLKNASDNLTSKGSQIKFFSDITKVLQKANALGGEGAINNIPQIGTLINGLIEERLKVLKEEIALREAGNIAYIFKAMTTIAPSNVEKETVAKMFKELGKKINVKIDEASFDKNYIVGFDEMFNTQLNKVSTNVKTKYIEAYDIEEHFGKALGEKFIAEGMSQGKFGDVIPSKSGELIAPIKTRGEVKKIWEDTRERLMAMSKMRAEIEKELAELERKRKTRGEELATKYIGFVEEMRKTETLKEVAASREKYDEQISERKLWEADGATSIKVMISKINGKYPNFKITEKAGIYSKYGDEHAEKRTALRKAVEEKAEKINNLILKYPECSDVGAITGITLEINKILKDPTLTEENKAEVEILCAKLTTKYLKPASFNVAVNFASSLDISNHVEKLDAFYKSQLLLAEEIAKAINSELERIKTIDEGNMDKLSNDVPHKIDELLVSVSNLTPGGRRFFS